MVPVEPVKQRDRTRRSGRKPWSFLAADQVPWRAWGSSGCYWAEYGPIYTVETWVSNTKAR